MNEAVDKLLASLPDVDSREEMLVAAKKLGFSRAFFNVGENGHEEGVRKKKITHLATGIFPTIYKAGQKYLKRNPATVQ